MSTMVYKSAVRMVLPELESKPFPEILAYFTERLGEPDDGYPDEEYLYYEQKSGSVRAQQDWYTRKWFVEKVLAYSLDEQEKIVAISISQLIEIQKELQEKFGVKHKAFFITYAWYNGGDETSCVKPTT